METKKKKKMERHLTRYNPVTGTPILEGFTVFE
jgi:hypothetical protein